MRIPLAGSRIIPHGTPGSAWAWCQARGLNPYHPEGWSDADRLAYELELAAQPPCRNPYALCPCHPTRYLDPKAGGEYWDDVTEEQVKAWVAEAPFVRGGFSKRTAQAFTFLEQFKPKRSEVEQDSESRP